MSTLVIFWQFILKGIEELSVVANQILSLEMVIIRLIHLKDMPSYQSILDLINEKKLTQNNNIDQVINEQEAPMQKKKIEKKDTKEQIKNTTQTKLKIETSSQSDKSGFI